MKSNVVSSFRSELLQFQVFRSDVNSLADGCWRSYSVSMETEQMFTHLEAAVVSFILLLNVDICAV